MRLGCLLVEHLRVGGVEAISDFPALDELPDAGGGEFVAHRWPLLGPFYERLEIDFVASPNHDISDGAIGDSAAYRSSGDAEELCGLGDGNTDDMFWSRHAFSLQIVLWHFGVRHLGV